MAKAKLTKSEREAWQKDLATLRAAVSQCEAVLRDDDEATKAAEADSDVAVIKTIVGDAKCVGDGRSQDAPARLASARGVLGLREMPNRISDVVYSDRKK